MNWITPVDVTPISSDWVDVNVTPYLPGGLVAAGALIQVVSVSGAHIMGWRCNGSTDARQSYVDGTVGGYCAVGVDGANKFEVYVDNATNTKVYLIGYFRTDQAVFFVNGVAKPLSSTGAWVDVTVNYTGALAAIFEVCAVVSTVFGLRNNGSTDNLCKDIASHCCPGAFVGLDASYLCEAYSSAGLNILYLLGYIKSDSIFHVNAVNMSLGSVGSYVDLAALPAGATGVYMFTHITSGAGFRALRKNGTSRDVYTFTKYVGWDCAECDASYIVEGKIDGLTVDFYRYGYSAPAPTGQPTMRRWGGVPYMPSLTGRRNW